METNSAPRNLLDEAMALDDGILASSSSRGRGRVVLIEDCVDTSGAFVLHHLIKRSLSSPAASVILVSFAHPFSHYDRILRKMGCNLAVQSDNKRFIFFDMLLLECPEGDNGNTNTKKLLHLYGEIHRAVEASFLSEGSRNTTIMIDDISLMEVACNGSAGDILNLFHYFCTLTAQFDCTLVTLNHEDIYLAIKEPTLLLQMEYLVDILIKAEPLATGLASDVHGQLTVLKKGIDGGLMTSKGRISNFHFRVKENTVAYFYPGSLSYE